MTSKMLFVMTIFAAFLVSCGTSPAPRPIDPQAELPDAEAVAREAAQDARATAEANRTGIIFETSQIREQPVDLQEEAPPPEETPEGTHEETPEDADQPAAPDAEGADDAPAAPDAEDNGDEPVDGDAPVAPQ